MSEALLQSLTTNAGVGLVDAGGLDAFLDARKGRLTVLFFTGDPEKKAETADVAVVLRELIGLYPDRFDTALVDRADEKALMERCKVKMFPSLAFFNGPEHLKTIPKIQDWQDYAEKLPRFLAQFEAEELADA